MYKNPKMTLISYKRLLIQVDRLLLTLWLFFPYVFNMPINMFILTLYLLFLTFVEVFDGQLKASVLELFFILCHT